MNNKIILIVAGLLILLGVSKYELSNLNPFVNNNRVSVDVLELSEPTDPAVKKEAAEVVDLIKSYDNVSKSEFRRLRDLMLDLARLVELDNEDQVIKNTDEIRQANSMAGVMLRLDMKNKYQNLSKESQDVIVASVGDDDVVLSKELRNKAIDGFKALAWAYNEVSK
jgi:hypothetical protein